MSSQKTRQWLAEVGSTFVNHEYIQVAIGQIGCRHSSEEAKCTQPLERTCMHHYAEACLSACDRQERVRLALIMSEPQLFPPTSQGLSIHLQPLERVRQLQ